MLAKHSDQLGEIDGCQAITLLAEEARMNVHKNARITWRGRFELVRRVVDEGQPASRAAAGAGLLNPLDVGRRSNGAAGDPCATYR